MPILEIVVRLISGIVLSLIVFLLLLWVVDIFVIGTIGFYCHLMPCSIPWIATYYPPIVLTVNLIFTLLIVYPMVLNIRVENNTSE